MIDLNQDQLFNSPIKCWIKMSLKWEEKWLIAILDGEFLCIKNMTHNRIPSIKDILYSERIISEDCTLKDPYQLETKKWKNIYDVPPELWGNVLCKKKNDDVNRATILTPALVSDYNGAIACEDWHYLPKGEFLLLYQKWEDFENEIKDTISDKEELF